MRYTLAKVLPAGAAATCDPVARHKGTAARSIHLGNIVARRTLAVL